MYYLLIISVWACRWALQHVHLLIIAHVPTLVSFMKTKIHHDTAKFPQKPFSHLRFMLEARLL